MPTASHEFVPLGTCDFQTKFVVVTDVIMFVADCSAAPDSVENTFGAEL